MRFLVDQDVFASTIKFLSDLGHDVVPVASRGRAEAPDAELLALAEEGDRILVTRDRDFGGLVFVYGQGPGIVYLRMSPATENSVHFELERVLSIYSEQALRSSFVVVEPGRHRIRRITM